MLGVLIILLVWNSLSGIVNIITFGKTGSAASGIVGGMCLFAAGTLSTIVFIKGLGILP